MQRHQRHRAAGLVHGVQVRNQRHILQKVRQPRLGVQPLEFGNRALELFDVLDAGFVLLALVLLQRLHVTGAFDQRLQEFGRLFFVHQLGQVDHQRRKGSQ